MTLRYLLIDHDDTLMDTFDLRAQITALAVETVFGQTIDGAAFLRDSHGHSLQQTGAAFASDAAGVQRFVDTYRAEYYSRNTVGLRVYDGMEATIRTLAERGIPIAVVTSKLGRGARAELEATGLGQWLPVVVGAEDVRQPKPSAEPLLKALAQIGGEPGTTIMVGDTPADVGGARNAGTQCAAALWGTRAPEPLIDAGPDHLLHAPADLLALFDAD